MSDTNVSVPSAPAAPTMTRGEATQTALAKEFRAAFANATEATRPGLILGAHAALRAVVATNKRFPVGLFCDALGIPAPQ